MKIDSFGLTDIGRRRPANEDNFLIADLNRSMSVRQTSLGLDHHTRLFGNSQGSLFAVADGMGGHEAGERASQLVVDGLITYILNTLTCYASPDNDDQHIRDELKSAMAHCQGMLQRDVDESPQRKGMGTTLTLAYVCLPKMYVTHIGDSRCYLCRQGAVMQVTRDHTMAQLHQAAQEDETRNPDDTQELIDPRLHNVLWNVIAADAGQMQPDIDLLSLQPDDVILLCTDGLSNYVSEEEIATELERSSTSEDVCRRLVALANDRGGKDNITTVCARFLE